MPTTLVLVRHGEARAGVDHVIGGPTGCKGLTDSGRQQAERLRDRLTRRAEIVPDVLLASTLPRAIETAEIVGRAFPDREVTTDCERWSMGRKARLDLVLDCAEPEKLAGFWRTALGYRDYYVSDSVAVLVPDEGNASPLVLQGVPEPKAGKNRMHLDIVVDDIEAEVQRLQLLGARRMHDGVQSFGETKWVTMADPEENEFCVCTGVEW